jgi:hypothetical protein
VPATRSPPCGVEAGREALAGVPSRFIAEMKLHEATAIKENPLERLKRQRAEAAARLAAVIAYILEQAQVAAATSGSFWL